MPRKAGSMARRRAMRRQLQLEAAKPAARRQAHQASLRARGLYQTPRGRGSFQRGAPTSGNSNPGDLEFSGRLALHQHPIGRMPTSSENKGSNAVRRPGQDSRNE